MAQGDFDVSPISARRFRHDSDLYKRPADIVKETGRALGAQ